MGGESEDTLVNSDKPSSRRIRRDSEVYHRRRGFLRRLYVVNVKPRVGLLKYLTELGEPSRLAVEERHHVNVIQSRRERRRVVLQNLVADQDAAMRGHDGGNLAEYLDAGIVSPVVKSVAKEVRRGSWWKKKG